MRNEILGAVLASLLAGTGGVAAAQEQRRDRDQIRDPTTHEPGAAPLPQERQEDRVQVHRLLRTEGGLTPDQMAAVRPDVDEYLSRGGDVGRLQETIRAALENGCRGECLGEAVRQTNRLMARGYAPVQAGETVRAALEEEGRSQQRPSAGADAEAAERLRARVDDRMRDRDADRTRDQDRDRDRDRDMMHEPGGMMQEPGGMMHPPGGGSGSRGGR